MGSVKFGQLYAAPRQLKQAHIGIQQLAQLAHLLARGLLHQPDGLALPLADLHCALARKIELCRRTQWQFSTRQP